MKTLFLSFLLFTLSIDGKSCTCFGVSIDSAFVYSPLIFEGRVVSQYENVFFHDRAEYSMITNLEVIKDYRGARERKIVTIVGGFGCDFFFKKNETYIVFAYQRESGIYTTSMCTPTKLRLKFELEQIKIIDRLSKEYYDEFNLTFNSLCNQKATRFEESEPIRTLRLAYYSEKRLADVYKYAFTLASVVSVACLLFLFFKRK